MLFSQVFSTLRAAFVLSALPLTFIAIVPKIAKAADFKFDDIYVFGDSLSDDGNTFNHILNKTGNGSPPFPYYQGRFSNGPVWVEELVKLLGIPANPNNNFAYGGANTGTNNTYRPEPLPDKPLNLPGLQTEIDLFEKSYPQADPNALYIVWAGANDYLGGGERNPSIPVGNIASAITKLSGLGAKNFFVLNLPDLGKLPGTSGDPAISNGLTTLTNFHNYGLANTISSLRQSLSSDINLISFDLNTIFNQVLAEPQKYGFTNTQNACLNIEKGTLCSDPDSYFFWDPIHPTKEVHRILAKSAYTSLTGKSVPEPAAEVAVLAFGALGAVSILKRQQKKVNLGKTKVS